MLLDFENDPCDSRVAVVIVTTPSFEVLATAIRIKKNLPPDLLPFPPPVRQLSQAKTSFGSLLLHC